MAAEHLSPPFLISIVVLLLHLRTSHSQQTYVNNTQLDCNINHPQALGFTCNAPANSCSSYLTFRSTPTYNNPATIAYLLSASASDIATLNNISDITALAPDTLVIVPVNCTCSLSYFQHNTSYILQHDAETYLTVANNTYQALTTCQSMIAQNPTSSVRNLLPNMRLNVPLRCACPTRSQTQNGFNHLLTYLVRQGNTYESIAAAFSGAGATVEGILAANNLTENEVIFFFTPLLVPLRSEPNSESISPNALPPLPQPPPPATPATPAADSGGSASRRWIFVGVGVGLGAIVLVSLGFLFWCLRRKRKTDLPPPIPPKKEVSSVGQKPVSDWSISTEGIRSAIETLTRYRFEELEKATGSFSEANRIGGSSLYRGTFNGDYAAVKIMKGDVSREIDALRQINHSHIIRLSGFCLHQGVTYLVYEYAQYGSLADWLRPVGDAKGKDSDLIREHHGLDWKQRVQIAYDVADALNYLHNFTNPPYIHKNLKSSNVLLDSNMRGKIANFGLARSMDGNDDQSAALTRHVVGTYGYMAPEYIENGLITPKLDVFALGVVILELLSGREPVINEKGDELLCNSIDGVMSGENVRGKLSEFMDPWFGEDYPLDLAYSMAELARKCVAHDLNERPLVSDIFMALSKMLSSSLDWDPSHEQRSTSFSLSE